MSWNRRQILTVGGAALAGVSAAGVFGRTARSQESADKPGPRSRRISLANLHTGEHLDLEFYRDGAYVPDALSAISVLLRDFRTGERHSIDPNLMDYLIKVAHTLGVDAVFSVISGYRSPQTNAALRDRSAGSHSIACTCKGGPSTCAWRVSIAPILRRMPRS